MLMRCSDSQDFLSANESFAEKRASKTVFVFEDELG